MTTLYDSPFSKPINTLRFLGIWVYPDRTDYFKINLFILYKMLMTSGAVFGMYMLFFDLYMVSGDFKKVTWNLCASILFIGEVFKSVIVFHKNNVVDKLRIRLHKDMESRKETEYEEIDRFALKTMHMLEKTFYALSVGFVIVWLVVWYMTHYWGKREWPLPARLPIEFDLSDDRTYNVGYFFCFLGVIPAISLGLFCELAMFSLLVQITREYEVLLKQIQKVNDLYVGDGKMSSQMEVNPYLLQMKTKMMLRKLSIRQQKIFKYANDFECVYNKPLLIHVFGVSGLMLVSAIQCLVDAEDDLANTSYQMGYLFILLLDLYLVCWYGTKINSSCRNVGIEAYSIKWYLMNKEAHIYVNMMILRSQNPPKITSGKYMNLNNRTFVVLLRNIYSWLTIFSELAFKNN